MQDEALIIVTLRQLTESQYMITIESWGPKGVSVQSVRAALRKDTLPWTITTAMETSEDSFAPVAIQHLQDLWTIVQTLVEHTDTLEKMEQR